MIARSPLYRLVCLFALVSLLVGCGPPEGDGDAGPDTQSGDVGADVADTGTADSQTGDTAKDPDTSPADTGGDTTTADATDTTGGDADGGMIEGCRESTPTDLTDREPVDTGSWVTTQIAFGDDGIRPAIRTGQFSVPSDGDMAHGVEWDEIVPQEVGVVEPSQPARGEMGYAATTIEVDEPTVLVAEMHGIYELFAGGTPYSGDIYGDDYLVPVPLEPGVNHLVVRYTRRTQPKLTLTRASEALAVDTGDATYPDLRVDRDTDLPLGLHTLNLSGRALTDVSAKVLENNHFAATERHYPALGPDARTQLGFDLDPKSEWSEADKSIEVQLRIEACELDEAYDFTFEFTTKPADEGFRRTFVSPVDESVQYYGVLPPENYTVGEQHGVVLSLHGAGVDAAGQATAYSQKEWAWVVAPTNRRPFGFNWEEWGHWNALNALDDAKQQWAVDESRVHVTGHSMGGHGTWHVGVHNPGTFATIVPSAGWESIYSYPPNGSSDRPPGTRGRARAHSDTQEYLSNIGNRSVYVIHGTADNNVPTDEGRKMCMKAKDEIEEDANVDCHFEEGAEHWWDGDAADGTDCVDWPPAWEMMKNRTVDPVELDFEYTTPGPWYGPEHSYVRIESSETPMNDVQLTSTKTDATTVELTTQNARSLALDGEALDSKGIDTITVDGTDHQVTDDTMTIGPEDGKTADQHGPLNQVFQSPFCFVYPKDGSDFYREFTSYLVSSWSVRGNGQACAMPYSKLDDATRQERNIIYVGLDPDRAELPDDRPFSWNGTDMSIGETTFTTVAGVTAFPEDDDLAAAVYARPDNENLLLHPIFMPFNSRRGMPDYFIISADSQGNAELNYGFYDAEWQEDSDLRD